MANSDRPRSRGRRRINDTVVMVDFGAKQRQEALRQSRRAARGSPDPRLPISQSSWASDGWLAHVLLGADSGRIARGRDYFRAGHVLSMELHRGNIVGLVKGTQLEPFTVEISVQPCDSSTRQAVIALLEESLEAYHSLLGGGSPVPMLSLPLMDDMRIERVWCDCPDGAKVCKHIVAVAMSYAQRLNADPLELLRLRGIDPGSIRQPQRENVPGQHGEPASQPSLSLIGEQPDAPVDFHEFWGNAVQPVVWDPIEVDVGLEGGRRDHLMEALETVTWTHVDQLDALHQLDRCYEELEKSARLFDYSRRLSALHEINDITNTAQAVSDATDGGTDGRS